MKSSSVITHYGLNSLQTATSMRSSPTRGIKQSVLDSNNILFPSSHYLCWVGQTKTKAESCLGVRNRRTTVLLSRVFKFQLLLPKKEYCNLLNVKNSKLDETGKTECAICSTTVPQSFLKWGSHGTTWMQKIKKNNIPPKSSSPCHGSLLWASQAVNESCSRLPPYWFIDQA